MGRNKITVVGAGNVGATAAYMAAVRGLGDIVLIDIVTGLAEGKALDIAQAGAVQAYDVGVIGTTEWEKTAGSNIVILTGGIARKPGMSRDDLLIKNVQICKDISANVAKYCPDCILIVVSNPLDAMVYTASKITKLPKNRIVGMAGVLDSARFCCFAARQLGVSAEEIKCTLMGGHGDDMVPLPRLASVGGIPLTEMLDEGDIAKLIERTRKGGTEIVNLLGYSAFYAPAAAVVKMADAILKDSKDMMCCCAYCEKEYGAGGYFIGVPVVLGKNGVEKVVELSLNADELAQFKTSLEHVKKLTLEVDKLI